MTADTKFILGHHVTIAIASIVVAVVLYLAGYSEQVVVAAIPYFLLFLVMLIGPARVVFPWIRRRFSGNFPINWRSELGIWFAIWAVIHVIFVFWARDWAIIEYLINMSPWAYGALVAVILAVILAFTSNERAFGYLGPRAWKWHQSHATYVIFWLVTVHIYDRAYFRPGFPSDEPLHWIYIIMFIIVVAIHVAGFAKVVGHYRRTGEYPKYLR